MESWLKLQGIGRAIIMACYFIYIQCGSCIAKKQARNLLEAEGLMRNIRKIIDGFLVSICNAINTEGLQLLA